MKLCKFVLIILSITQHVTADDQVKVKIICGKSDNQNWDNVGRLNTCILRKETKLNTPNSFVDNGDDTISYEALSFQSGSEISQFPQGFKHSFPRLKVLHIKNAKFTSLTEYDMMQFGVALELIHIETGNINVLSRNLFKHNTNLRRIKFEKCPLKFIEPGFLENISLLKNLVNIELNDCSCINGKFESKSGRGIYINILNHGKCTQRPPTTDLFELTERSRRNNANAPEASFNFISAMKLLSRAGLSHKTKVGETKSIAEKFDCKYFEDFNESHCRGNVEEENTMIERINFYDANQESAMRRTQKLLIVDSLLMFIPLNIGQLMPNLKHLVIEAAGLTKITKSIFSINLAGLELLDLSNNIIIEILPNVFDNLLNLKILDLSSNHIVSIESALLKPLVNLKLLYLDGNKLLKISSNLLNILPVDIQVLDLSNNDCIDMAYPYNSNLVSIATGLVNVCL